MLATRLERVNPAADSDDIPQHTDREIPDPLAAALPHRSLCYY